MNDLKPDKILSFNPVSFISCKFGLSVFHSQKSNMHFNIFAHGIVARNTLLTRMLQIKQVLTKRIWPVKRGNEILSQ